MNEYNGVLVCEKPFKPCPFAGCARDLNNGVILNAEGVGGFEYLEVGQSMHIECYVKLCVQKAIESELLK